MGMVCYDIKGYCIFYYIMFGYIMGWLSIG